MKAVEFCYWLQGYFELAEVSGATRLDVLGTNATECIKSHLALVRKVEPRHANAFVLWLDLYMRDRDAVGASGVRVIQETLAAQFQHVIDPSYGGDQKELQSAHDAGRPPQIGGVGPDGLVSRC